MKRREGGSEEISASRALFPLNKRNGGGVGASPTCPSLRPITDGLLGSYVKVKQCSEGVLSLFSLAVAVIRLHA